MYSPLDREYKGKGILQVKGTVREMSNDKIDEIKSVTFIMVMSV